ncbi:MAG: glycosyltransferase family 2 protein [Candidatus Omnitrophota bacterium]
MERLARSISISFERLIMSSSVSVIILNWNGLHLLPDCLESLAQQTWRNFETIFVDNGSVDGSADWVKTHYPQVRVICLDSNRGFCGGNNAGIRAAEGEFIVLLNNDTLVERGWLENLCRVVMSDPKIAACDSKILYFNERNRIWTSGANYSIAGTTSGRWAEKLDGKECQQSSDVFVACACAAIYRKSVFDEIGLLDEDFFAGYEDVDWSFRAHLCGYRIVNVPLARVYHKVSATHGLNSKMFVRNGQRNVSAVYIKNMPQPLFTRFLLLHFIYTLGSMMFFLKIGRGCAFFQGKWDLLMRLPALWCKRQRVQKQRRVSSTDIEALLERNWFKQKLAKAKGVES